DALFIRANALAAEAAKLKKIDGFAFDVVAIVVDPRPDKKNRVAIVTGDEPAGPGRVYVEGDSLKDGAGQDLPIKVVKISEGSIKLMHEDLEFIRELASPD